MNKFIFLFLVTVLITPVQALDLLQVQSDTFDILLRSLENHAVLPPVGVATVDSTKSVYGDIYGVAAGETLDIRVDLTGRTAMGTAGGETVSLYFNKDGTNVSGTAGSNSVSINIDRRTRMISGVAGSNSLNLTIEKDEKSYSGYAGGNTMSLTFSARHGDLDGIAMGNTVSLRIDKGLFNNVDIAVAVVAACVETVLHENEWERVRTLKNTKP